MKITKNKGEGRPSWLKDNDAISGRIYHPRWGLTFQTARSAAEISEGEWDAMIEFEIADSHPYAKVAAAGLKYWPGGAERPADLDPTRPIMYRDGELHVSKTDFEGWDWTHSDKCYDLIGYTPKPRFNPLMPFQTRDGRPARLLASDLKDDVYPLAVAILHPNGEESLHYHTREGRHTTLTGYNSVLDLVNIPVRQNIRTETLTGVAVDLTLEDGKPVAIELAQAA